ncbi:amp dependent CoA ligase [Panus rudis PR-1116 ss-1]|nr:amp dependent CoA ligase [Panus rudis PR-1116 ss-1]
MYLKSLYPLPPPIPDRNFHYSLSGVPSSSDYVLHIDGLTGRQRSRKEFDELVLDGATALGASKLQGGLNLSKESGDMVGIYSPNTLDFIALVHSLLAIATPFALLPAFATPFELLHAIKTARPTCLFAHPSVLPQAIAAGKEIGLDESHVYVLEGKYENKKSFADLVADARRRKIPRVPVRPVVKDTLAYLVFSSGTSGLPKAVMISHGNLWAIIQSAMLTITEEMKLTKQEPPSQPMLWMAALPLYHSYGLHMFGFRGFLAPSTFVILPKWDTKRVLELVGRYKINVLPMVPSMLHNMVHSGYMEKADLSSVSQVMVGAAASPKELYEKVHKHAPNVLRITEGYGLSEATVSAALKPAPGMFGLQPILGSCGILLPGMEARIVRDDGSEADWDEPGEIWLRGGNIALGYYGNERATREAFVADGWLRTGDKLKADRSQTLYFVERAKDTLKVSGVQVSPLEIENVLNAHPGKLIIDVSVAGVSGDRLSDEKVPRAWVVLSQDGKRVGAAKVSRELELWVQKNLSRPKWLRGGLEVVDEIPKLPTGKVLRRVLQERYERQRAVSQSRARL